MVTIANPDRRADVRLEALSLARLRYSFLQDRACSECSFRLMLFQPRTGQTEPGRKQPDRTGPDRQNRTQQDRTGPTGPAN